jgi:hypothetical protein
MTVADSFRTQLVQSYKGLEKELTGNEDVQCTLYLPHGAIRLFISGITASTSGIIEVKGLKEDGKHIVVWFPVTVGYFSLEIVSGGPSRKSGFVA